MARRLEPTVFLAAVSPITVGLGAGTIVLVRMLGGPWWAALVSGGVVWVARVGLAALIARRVRTLAPRIDPFALREPWRFFVSDALSARKQVRGVLDELSTGPLATRLAEIAEQLENGIASVWQVAQRGQQLTDARRNIDIKELDRALESIPADDPRHRSARAQRDSHDRLAAREDEIRERLEVLDAQLDEAVVRVAELAIRSSGAGDTLQEIAARVDTVVTELDTLRIALDEVGIDP